ncbi:hypothetical protein IGS68_18035 [Skermanella sp. TT6]|uniref:Uncharacterized protein n=1 Tax=Skermanella cutis TaxID=2775420 RepID=A0ABX7B294_9PROT|nr:hypothetical protein [Skermanella sp. TT6]QQP87964.1 hypothetical protein IGS68_18035 [Skermanella sp. TT6]
MAESSLTIPGAVSRRFLFSVATAAPVTLASAGLTPGSAPAAFPAGVAAVLERYRAVGLRLRDAEATRAGAYSAVPAMYRRGPSGGKPQVGRPEWTVEEIRQLGLPPDMPRRFSQADLEEHHLRAVTLNPENREELTRQFKARLAAYKKRKARQKDWLDRAGLTPFNREIDRLNKERASIGRELMALLTASDGAAANA